jgi:hypothetical protein
MLLSSAVPVPPGNRTGTGARMEFNLTRGGFAEAIRQSVVSAIKIEQAACQARNAVGSKSTDGAISTNNTAAITINAIQKCGLRNIGSDNSGTEAPRKQLGLRVILRQSWISAGRHGEKVEAPPCLFRC